MHYEVDVEQSSIFYFYLLSPAFKCS